MALEIISLTSKGEALSHSVRRASSPDWKVVYGWRTIYFTKQMGGRTTFDKIASMVFGGNEHNAKSVISLLKSKNIVTGD